MRLSPWRSIVLAAAIILATTEGRADAPQLLYASTNPWAGPDELVTSGPQVFFRDQFSLGASDGTVAGTGIIVAVDPAAGGGGPGFAVAIGNGRIVFDTYAGTAMWDAQGGLSSGGGFPGGAEIVSSTLQMAAGNPIIVQNGVALFDVEPQSATDFVALRSDGTPEGTYLLPSPCGAAGNRAMFLGTLGSNVYITANACTSSDDKNLSLFKYDGTSLTALADVSPGGTEWGSGFGDGFQATWSIGDTIIFATHEVVPASEEASARVVFFRVDAQGVTTVLPWTVPVDTSNTFVAQTESGMVVCTETGYATTSLLNVDNPSPTSLGPCGGLLATIEGRALYFDSINQPGHVYASDGTAAGTAPLATFPETLPPTVIGEIGGRTILVLDADWMVGPWIVIATDGTDEGSEVLVTVPHSKESGPNGPNPIPLAIPGSPLGIVLMTDVFDAIGELLTTDGTAAGTAVRVLGVSEGARVGDTFILSSNAWQPGRLFAWDLEATSSGPYALGPDAGATSDGGSANDAGDADASTMDAGDSRDAALSVDAGSSTDASVRIPEARFPSVPSEPAPSDSSSSHSEGTTSCACAVPGRDLADGVALGLTTLVAIAYRRRRRHAPNR